MTTQSVSDLVQNLRHSGSTILQEALGRVLLAEAETNQLLTGVGLPRGVADTVAAAYVFVPAGILQTLCVADIVERSFWDEMARKSACTAIRAHEEELLNSLTQGKQISNVAYLEYKAALKGIVDATEKHSVTALFDVAQTVTNKEEVQSLLVELKDSPPTFLSDTEFQQLLPSLEVVIAALRSVT